MQTAPTIATRIVLTGAPRALQAGSEIVDEAFSTLLSVMPDAPLPGMHALPSPDVPTEPVPAALIFWAPLFPQPASAANPVAPAPGKLSEMPEQQAPGTEEDVVVMTSTLTVLALAGPPPEPVEGPTAGSIPAAPVAGLGASVPLDPAATACVRRATAGFFAAAPPPQAEEAGTAPGKVVARFGPGPLGATPISPGDPDAQLRPLPAPLPMKSQLPVPPGLTVPAPEADLSEPVVAVTPSPPFPARAPDAVLLTPVQGHARGSGAELAADSRPLALLSVVERLWLGTHQAIPEVAVAMSAKPAAPAPNLVFTGSPAILVAPGRAPAGQSEAEAAVRSGAPTVFPVVPRAVPEAGLLHAAGVVPSHTPLLRPAVVIDAVPLPSLIASTPDPTMLAGVGDVLVAGPLPATATLGGTTPAAAPTLAQLVRAMDALVVPQGDGSTEIALAPEELGKVRVRMQADAQNPDRLVVVMTFDRPETMDLFRRHAADLSDALRAAGYGEARLDFGQSGPGGGSGTAAGPAEAGSAVESVLPGSCPDAGSTAIEPRAMGSLDIRL